MGAGLEDSEKEKHVEKEAAAEAGVGEVVVVQFRETDYLVQKHLPKGM